MRRIRILGDPSVTQARRLDAPQASIAEMIFQNDKFLVPAEWNLIGAIAAERDRRAAVALGNPGFRTIKDFLFPANTDAQPFRLRMYGSYALVGNELTYVGPPTDTDQFASTTMNIDFGPPPASGTRVDFAFIEGWYAEVAPKEASDAASKALYDGGNPDLGADLTDNAYAAHAYFTVRDPAVTTQENNQETTRRIQSRWRVRIVTGVDAATYPDYFSDPQVTGRGDAGAGVSAYPYRALTDALVGAGVAGDGSFAAADAFRAVDGYTWAIPICAAYRVAGDDSLQPGDPNVVGYTRGYVKDLRNPIVPRPQIVQGPPGPPGPPGEPAAPGAPGAPSAPLEVRATGLSIPVLAYGNYGVGQIIGGSGRVNTWAVPSHGDNVGDWSMNNAPPSLVIPFLGGFPLHPRDLVLPPGWRWQGQLMGVCWRSPQGDDPADTTSYTFGLRLRNPGTQIVTTLTWALAMTADGKGAWVSLATVPGSSFPIPDPGDAASYGTWNGLWRTEVYTSQSGVNNWNTGGVFLHLFAVKIS